MSPCFVYIPFTLCRHRASLRSSLPSSIYAPFMQDVQPLPSMFFPRFTARGEESVGRSIIFPFPCLFHSGGSIGREPYKPLLALCCALPGLFHGGHHRTKVTRKMPPCRFSTAQIGAKTRPSLAVDTLVGPIFFHSTVFTIPP